MFYFILVLKYVHIVCRAIKYFTKMDVAFTRVSGDELQHTNASFYSAPEVLAESSEFNIDDLITHYDDLIENFNRRGSNWLVSSITAFSLSTVPYRPLK
jgi:hypothetical protein